MGELIRKNIATNKRLALIGEDKYAIADGEILERAYFWYGYLRSCKWLTLSDGWKLLLLHLLSLRENLMVRIREILKENAFWWITEIHLTGWLFDRQWENISWLDKHPANWHKFPWYKDLIELITKEFPEATLQVEKTYPVKLISWWKIERDVHVIIRKIRWKFEYLEMWSNSRKIWGRDEIWQIFY